MQNFLVGIIMVVIGIISFSRSFVEWIIRFNNMLKGAQTNITEGTIIAARVIGGVIIVVGLIMVMGGFGS